MPLDKSSKPDLYATITAKIIESLEAGAPAWVKPWNANGTGTVGGTRPRNAVTGRPYSGVNVLLLWGAGEAAGYAKPRWLTFKQAIDAGGAVRKGEKATQIVFVSTFAKTEENDAGELEDRRIPFLKSYMVFNVDQCDGLPDSVRGLVDVPAPKTFNERIELADEFIAATGARIDEGAGEAFYMPSRDMISMPAFERFKTADNFYSTAFHELTHWTGAKHRLDREFGKRFGDMAYAAEELVAELAAAFMCAEFEFDGDLRHAGYIGHWIKLLKDDKRAIFTAAGKAQAAVDYMRGLALAAPVEAVPAPAPIIVAAPIAAPVAAALAPTEPTASGLQYVLDGCAKDRTRTSAAQFNLF